ncbi:ParB/RepB/Spo0J family partition protein [Bradyrhizobium septentrionale]|uniref:ParB/RepB/Spo0J family partition protein n=1 Tax=Bradyrhizobium septentrionale TaxID=1404411 RepID=UPI00159684B5|nr:ParB/RepB/Spo0J family partition protein [Bradyrhizobium septentrionale]UGY28869.1 ParB/RepB/Spo0J family partition protein [Bradyrhizobium septentrionale]
MVKIIPANVKQISIGKILIPKECGELDQRLAQEIAESLQIQKVLSPIIVRKVTVTKQGEQKSKIVLVAGAHRVEAAKLLGQDSIDCIFVDADDEQAQLIRIGENLWRKHLPVLKRSEDLVEWMELASTYMNYSGQLVRKNKRGRPSGSIALAAKLLPPIGRTIEARKKVVDRAIKIAGLAPEVKKAVKAAKLDNNQKALLKIANQKGLKPQLKKVADLGAVIDESNNLKDRETNDEVDRKSGKRSRSLNKKTSVKESTATAKAKEATPNETTYEELESFWDRSGRQLWAYASLANRERFIEKLRRAKCNARVDLVTFVEDVFRGRGKVKKADLAALAEARGLPIARVKKTAEALGYRSKRKGHSSGSEWFLLNKDKDWKEQHPAIECGELEAARKAASDNRQKRGRELSDQDDYFADLE